MLGYLIERQLMITYLRKQLVKERETLTSVRHEASTDLLGSLPGFSHFQDRLAMEYRRAATTQQPLSLVMVVLKHVQTVSDPMEVAAAFSDAAKTLMHKLRGEDSIYLFGTGIFCIVLPGVTAENTCHIADRLTDGLQDVLGGSARFSFRIQSVNYPEHAKSARELEEAVRPFAPRRSGGAVAEADAVRTTD